jgi:hypothetical protein
MPNAKIRMSNSPREIVGTVWTLTNLGFRRMRIPLYSTAPPLSNGVNVKIPNPKVRQLVPFCHLTLGFDLAFEL